MATSFSIVAIADAFGAIGGLARCAIRNDAPVFKRLVLSSARLQRERARSVVVMGRLTWEALGAPVPGCVNIVLSFDPNERDGDGRLVARSVDAALDIAAKISPEGEVFVIGGGMTFASAISHPRCAAVYLTIFDAQRPVCRSCEIVFPTKKLAELYSLASEHFAYRFSIPGLSVYERREVDPSPDLGCERRGSGGASGIEALVCADIAARQKLGIQKYGVSLAEAPHPPKYWIQHAYEEALDLSNYLKRLIVGLPDSDEPEIKLLT